MGSIVQGHELCTKFLLSIRRQLWDGVVAKIVVKSVSNVSHSAVFARAKPFFNVGGSKGLGSAKWPPALSLSLSLWLDGDAHI